MPSDQHWDHYSDQPYRLAASSKPSVDNDALVEYLKTLATGLGLAPAILWRYLSLKPRVDIDADRFVGLSISARPEWLDAQRDLVAELEVRNLLLRIPAWETDRLAEFSALIEGYSGHQFVINILQNAQSQKDPLQWADQVYQILESLPSNVAAVQIANAINRKKWGCRHSGDYLRLESAIQPVREHYPDIRFLGSSVIDFEPLVTLRTLFNFHEYYHQGVAAELYVNRRGAPDNAQFGVFDLARKIRLIAAMASLSNRSTTPLWITETNWPLLNTRPYTPNSGHPRSTVDEQTQARYLTDYYRIAWHSEQVQAVYWWQLINPT